MISPRYPDVGVIGLVPDVWGQGVWMPRHHVLTRLARHFHVVWLDPALEWRDIWLHGVRRPQHPADAPNGALPGFTLYRPGRWAPRVYRPAFVAAWTERARLRHARALLRRAGARKIVLYLWRPEFAPTLDLLDHDLACYHVDDEYTFSETEQPLDAGEAALLKRVDQVFIHSPTLLQKKGGLNAHTLFVPNGVDYAAYTTPAPEPRDLAAVPHPRIGYVGVIKEQLDLGALLALARRRPQWSFVLIGPSRVVGADAVHFTGLQQLPNVYILGAKPVTEVPAYVQHLDACLLCYRETGYTKFIYPLKLHEALAAGKPVVATPLPALQEFHNVITLARGADAWEQALSTALASDSQSAVAVERRRTVAREHDWTVLVDRVADAMIQRLGTR